MDRSTCISAASATILRFAIRFAASLLTANTSSAQALSTEIEVGAERSAMSLEVTRGDAFQAVSGERLGKEPVYRVGSEESLASEHYSDLLVYPESGRAIARNLVESIRSGRLHAFVFLEPCHHFSFCSFH